MNHSLWVLVFAVACKPGGSGPNGTDTDASDDPFTGVCSLEVEVSWNDDFPAVPEFSFSPASTGNTVTLTLDDATHTHRWRLDVEAGQSTVAVPFDPGVRASYLLEVDTADGACLGGGDFENGAYDEGALDSTGQASGRRDFFLLPIKVEAAGEWVVVWNESGEPLWRYSHSTNLRSAELDDAGRGVWLLELQDGFVGGFDEDAGTDLRLVSWTGEVLETLPMPAGHHDWQIGDGRLGDNGTVTLLGREHMEEIEQMCSEIVYGDTVQSIDVSDGEPDILYGTVADGFPTPLGCEALNMGIQSGDGVAYSYFNGMQRFGDTYGVSASGLVHGLVLGGSDGTWNFVSSDANSDLNVVPAHGDLPTTIAQAPHSVQCTEGIDWGDGVSADPGILTCVAYNRRQFGGGPMAASCDTVDLFRADPANAQVDYLATFPPVDFAGDRWAGCSTTNHHGNVGIVGEPNPDGDGITRLALFAAASGAITTVVVTSTPTGTEIALDYVIAPSQEGSVNGWFATPVDRFGASHEVFPN